ncbi:hybrid sensor histidine kinase/response regulator [Massilia yuzhufengensis]|uniref:histidine kinase n=1 Tax=Massilia yuzhufengensis TaxID=1164594 RepID=A0A1I1J9I2_9BURK|nr:ATP-binding protein [Massilia yuzhufengensis]SFC45237.1 Signal transduction histidine kinase [Massilia yuzhufengensis]
MGTYDESAAGSEQRSVMGDQSGLGAALRDQDPYQRIAALEAELSHARILVRERDRLEEQLVQLREANEHLVMATVSAQSLRDLAEATNRRQTEFLAMLAHELRNPLAPLSMSASLLTSLGGTTGKLAHVAGVVRRQVDHMARLLDDLLDAARISSGKITLAVRPLALGAALDQAVETVAPRIRERGQQLQVELPGEALTIEGDPVRLTQVFANLLGNASKYTGDGGAIVLRAWRDDQDVVVQVSDNGTGIGADMLPQVFDLFIQGPRSLARSEGGLGIGLNVVRNLVGMHGGSVTADSAGEGRGSSFTVRLPLSGAAAPVAEPPAGPSTGEASCRILLVEDNVDACDTLRTLLELAGHEVAVAYDGRAGLEEARARRYDIVICDIGLPGIDGFAVMEQLRADASTDPAAGRLFAIALSGYGQSEDRERALEAGFDRYLVKPAAPAALLALVGQAREARQAA